MTFLVDANILSEATKPEPDARALKWLTEHEGELVIDAIILAELALGVLALPKGKRRSRLEAWLAQVSATVECLSWDSPVSRRWAELVADLRRSGRAMPLFDSMIAATALEHRLIVATRNVRDFELAGVEVIDPFA